MVRNSDAHITRKNDFIARPTTSLINWKFILGHGEAWWVELGGTRSSKLGQTVVANRLPDRPEKTVHQPTVHCAMTPSGSRAWVRGPSRRRGGR